MEPGPDLEERAWATTHPSEALRRLRDPGEKLEERPARRGDGPPVVQLVGLLLGQGVAEAVAELLLGPGRSVQVGRVAQSGEAGADLGQRQR